MNWKRLTAFIAASSTLIAGLHTPVIAEEPDVSENPEFTEVSETPEIIEETEEIKETEVIEEAEEPEVSETAETLEEGEPAFRLLRQSHSRCPHCHVHPFVHGFHLVYGKPW